MNTIEQNESLVKKNPCQFITMGVKRDDDGLRIKLQSVVDWKCLKSPKKFVLGSVPCYHPRQERLEGIDSIFSTAQSHEIEGLPNLTLLLAENIKQGVTFFFPPVPISDERIKVWAEQFRNDCKILYHLYIKPREFTVEITTRIVETDKID